MRASSLLVGWAMVSALTVVCACGGGQGVPEPAQPVALTFPFADPSAVTEIHNFALHPWSTDGERHSGMDIVPPYLDLAGTSGMRKYTIVAPADGTVSEYVEDLSGAGYASYVVILKLDSFWHLMLVFEPQSSDAATNAEQHASFSVQVGQTVQRGDVIGDLVVSRVEGGSYPHLHFGVFYKDPLESWDQVWKTLRVHDGSTPSPEILGERLGIPTTFFCPYDYLMDAGRAVLDAVPKLDQLGNACSCACSYGSSGGDCGSCP